MNFKRRARGRTTKRQPGVMNKTEAAFAELLAERQRRGEITAWWFEPMKLRLAPLTFYSPDFVILHNDGMIEVAEVKGGFIEDDAMVKFKCAAEIWWMFDFRMYQKKRKADPFVMIRGSEN